MMARRALYQNFALHWHLRYDHDTVFVGARYKHVRIHEGYGSTYIPLGPVGHSPQLEQAPSARDPFRFRHSAIGRNLCRLRIFYVNTTKQKSYVGGHLSGSSDSTRTFLGFLEGPSEPSYTFLLCAGAGIR